VGDDMEISSCLESRKHWFEVIWYIAIVNVRQRLEMNECSFARA
jgi:hypothetical protein